jgi:hypothetical protein
MRRPIARHLPSVIACAVLCGASCGIDDRSLIAGFPVGAAATSGGNGEDDGGAGTDEASAGAGGDESRAVGGAPVGGEGPGVAGDPGQGGDLLSGSSGQGGGGPSGSAGMAGSGGAGGSGGIADDGPCGDLDRNGVQDCEETLVQNARFDQSVDEWTAELNMLQSWSNTDARGLASSGSLKLRNERSSTSAGYTLAGAGQCLFAWTAETYELGARAFIDPESGDGRAVINLLIYGNDGCTGTLLGSVTPAFLAEKGAWQVMHSAIKMPAGTRSVYLRLAVEKPLSEPPVEALFDDVLFRKK